MAGELELLMRGHFVGRVLGEGEGQRGVAGER